MPLLGGVQSTQRCPYRCEFCAITSFYNHGMKQRPIKNVVEEIKQMPNKLFILHDPSLTANPKYARELFKELIKQKIRKAIIRLKKACPELKIATHIIAGFPTETEEDFEKTLDLIIKADIDFGQFYPMSLRPDTPAVNINPKIQDDVIEKRVRHAQKYLRKNE